MQTLCSKLIVVITHFRKIAILLFNSNFIWIVLRFCIGEQTVSGYK